MSRDFTENEPAREISVRSVLIPGISAEVSFPLSQGARSARSRLKRQMAAQVGRPHDDVPAAFTALIAEASLEGMNAARRARVWSRVYYLLGVPAAALAAAAGVTALVSTTGRVAAGVIALASAALSAVVTTLDSESRRKANEAMAAGWQGLAERARVAVLELRRDPQWERTDSSIAALIDLNREREELGRGKPPE